MSYFIKYRVQIDFYFRTQSKFSISFFFLVFLFDFILPVGTFLEFFRCQLLTVPLVATFFKKSIIDFLPFFPSARVILFFCLFIFAVFSEKSKMILEVTNYSTIFSFGCKSLKLVIIFLLLTKAF